VSRKIIYIAAIGRSGSTMLDSILGTQENHFSLGELINLAKNGIINEEYCSCGSKVIACEFWAQVIKDWNDSRRLSIVQYSELIDKYFRSYKYVFKTYFIFKRSNQLVLDFLHDSKLLYELIFNHSREINIIDSSKNPLYILLLRNLGFNLEIVYLTRNYSGFLNSNRKLLQKDLKRGVERDISPIPNYLALSKWIYSKILVRILTIGLRVNHIGYDSMIIDLKNAISKIVPVSDKFRKTLENRGPFYSKHLAAGNKMRMDSTFYVNSGKNGSNALNNLNYWEKFYSRVIDRIFI
jgi:hypothetical protein